MDELTDKESTDGGGVIDAAPVGYWEALVEIDACPEDEDADIEPFI